MAISRKVTWRSALVACAVTAGVVWDPFGAKTQTLPFNPLLGFAHNRGEPLEINSDLRLDLCRCSLAAFPACESIGPVSRQRSRLDVGGRHANLVIAEL
jgi:hypothetical protein